MDILGVGFPELVFILIIAMMVFGPRRLPEIAAKAGKIVRDLRGMSQGLLTEWQREITVAARLDELELEKTRQELTKTQQELKQAQKSVATEAASLKERTIAPPDTQRSKEQAPAAAKTPESDEETTQSDQSQTDRTPETLPEEESTDATVSEPESTPAVNQEPEDAESSMDDSQIPTDTDSSDSSSSSASSSALPPKPKEVLNE